MNDNEPEEYHDYCKPERKSDPLGVVVVLCLVVLGLLGAALAFKA